MSTPSESSEFRAPSWAWMVATGFGSGRLRPAPGTWGSLAALVVWSIIVLLSAVPFTSWAMAHPAHPRLVVGYGSMEISTVFSGMSLGADPRHWVSTGYWLCEGIFLALPALMTWIAVRASDHVARETGLKDPAFIVADEWAGMWIALWAIRWQFASEVNRLFAPGGWRWLALLALPFLLFRLLDIWKPWPIRQLQVLTGGEGIVADDVVAGLLCIPLVQLLLPFLIAWLRRV